QDRPEQRQLADVTSAAKLRNAISRNFDPSRRARVTRRINSGMGVAALARSLITIPRHARGADRCRAPASVPVLPRHPVLVAADIEGPFGGARRINSRV